MNSHTPVELIPLFRDGLRRSVREGETVLIFTNPRFPFPQYIPAAAGAIRDLGAEVYVLEAPNAPTLVGRYAIDAWKAADIVIAMFAALPPHMWMYSEGHNDVLASGTRTFLVMEPVPTLRRLLPHDDVISRGYAGGKRMAAAAEIRIVDEVGTDLVMRKDGRKALVAAGVTDRPGRWDHWGGAMVGCAPLEDSAEGTLVLQPGDVIMGLLRRVEHPVTLTFREGLITDITGGYEAKLLRDLLESFDDENAFRLSHVNWGTDHRASWNVVGMDIESYYGSVDVAIGRNMFASPDEYSGFGGSNWSMVHCDIGMLGKRFYLNGELIVDAGEIVPEGLR
jgi:2,5-dihydroxypyridine 5,6-dioxygenase